MVTKASITRGASEVSASQRYLAVASMIGMTPNGLRFEYEPPTQAMLTVEKTRGITGYYPIFVR